MAIQVQTRSESRRGCGFRKPGGIYLIGPPEGRPCCKLPFPLTVCPTCGSGIHVSRSWTWVDADKLFDIIDDDHNHLSGCLQPPEIRLFNPCPLASHIGKAGLLWIGEAYYKTPEGFLLEARNMGISRRIPAVPKGFKLGETWVLLAHRKGIQKEEPIDSGLLGGTGTQVSWTPAIFSIFKPTAMEYVIKGGETEEELERLVKRGLTPVEINPRRAYK
jgi:hypothetical protein